MTDKLEEIRAELEQALPRNDPTDAANWAAEHGRRLLRIAEAAEWYLNARATMSPADPDLNRHVDVALNALRTALSPNPDKEEGMSEPHDSILDPCASLEQEVHTLTQQVEKARRTLELVKADAVIGLGSEAPKMNLQKIRERVRDTLNAMEGE